MPVPDISGSYGNRADLRAFDVLANRGIGRDLRLLIFKGIQGLGLEMKFMPEDESMFSSHIGEMEEVETFLLTELGLTQTMTADILFTIDKERIYYERVDIPSTAIKLQDGSILDVGFTGTYYLRSDHSNPSRLIDEVREQLFIWGGPLKLTTEIVDRPTGRYLVWSFADRALVALETKSWSEETKVPGFATVFDPAIGIETRITNATTGAQKGAKDAKYNLIPTGALEELAKLYGFGATKYEARNWERGYEFSLSYDALQRHANQWWSGQNTDIETQLSHMASVAWHAFTLFTLLKTHPELDDRPGSSISPPFKKEV